MEICQSDKSPDFGLQTVHSFHLPKEKTWIKTNSAQVTGCLKKWSWQGQETFWICCCTFLLFFFCHYNRHFKLKKEVKKNFTTIGKSLETLHFTTRGFIWRLWTNWSPSGGQKGVADSFVQIAGVPWGRPLGMPAGKCVRLSLNEKLSKVQLLRLRATFHALPLFYLRTQILRPFAHEN